MAKKTYYSFKKSEREKIRNKKKQEKLERKQEAKERKTAMMEAGEETDPDIADIIPGPQPSGASEE
jgi:hypothetical protein